jgi:hypothetical protein
MLFFVSWCVSGASLVRVCSMFVRFLWKPAAATIILLRWSGFAFFLHAIMIVADTGFIKWKQSGNMFPLCFRFAAENGGKWKQSGNKADTNIDFPE